MKSGDLFESSQVEFLVLAAETGGRVDDRSRELVRDLARARVAGEREVLQRSLLLGWTRRLWGLLSVGLQRVCAQSVAIQPDRSAGVCDSGGAVDLARVLEEAYEIPEVSRLPGR